MTYDLRKCGQSGTANRGISGLGLLWCRDVVGSLRYANSRQDLASMRNGLYSRCMGGNSTVVAMARWPEQFEDVEALVLLNLVSGKSFTERGAESFKMNPQKAAECLDERVRQLTDFRLEEETPLRRSVGPGAHPDGSAAARLPHPRGAGRPGDLRRPRRADKEPL